MPCVTIYHGHSIKQVNCLVSERCGSDFRPSTGHAIARSAYSPIPPLFWLNSPQRQAVSGFRHLDYLAEGRPDLFIEFDPQIYVVYSLLYWTMMTRRVD